MRQGGFTYLGLLFAIAFMGLLLAGASEVWQLVAQREREEQLLFVGRAFDRALQSYRESTPADRRPEWPQRLEDLVEDRRHGLEVRRHLRRLYADPITGTADWGLVRSGREIVAIHSRSDRKPLRRARFLPEEEGFAAATTYAQWIFGAWLGDAQVARTGQSAASDRDPAATALAGEGEVGSPDDAAVPAMASGVPGSPAAPTDACHGELLASLRLCAAIHGGFSPATLGRCNSEASMRYAACRQGK